jgi:polyribonucleotide nucleotidyltransferase
MTDNTKIKIDSLKGEVLIYHLDPKMIINAWTLIQSLLQSVYTNAVFFAELVRIEKTKLIFKIKERFFGYIILHFFDDNKYQIENFYWVKITKVIPINQIELAFTQAPNTWKK